MAPTRRRFLKQAGAGLFAVGSLLAIRTPVRAACQRMSGAGSHTLGPFDHAQEQGKQVFLVTDLGFDETMMFCKITTNFEPLLFPTAKLGVVALGAHELYMNMESTRIDSMKFKMGSDGPQVTFTGTLRSETRLFSGEKTKTYIEEEVAFSCDAIALGPEVKKQSSKIDFSLTAHYAPQKEQAAIFGEQPTFAGHLLQGNII